MIGPFTGIGHGAGHGRGLWPLLLLVLAAALVPAICVLWFMNAAINNEHLAVRQRLTDAYQAQLEGHRGRILNSWAVYRERAVNGPTPALQFRELISPNFIASAIVLDTEGRPLFPRFTPVDAVTLSATRPTTEPTTLPADDLWERAAGLETYDPDLLKAAEAYGQLTVHSKDPGTRGRAYQAQARCLLRAGKNDEAVNALSALQVDPELRRTTDALGRSIRLNSELLILQIIGPAHPRFDFLAMTLAVDLEDYSDPTVSVTQRLFLMESLAAAAPHYRNLFGVEALHLADAYLQVPQPAAEPDRLTPTSLPQVWQIISSDRRAILLLKQEGLVAHLSDNGGLHEASAGVTMRLEPPGGMLPGPVAFMSTPISPAFPGWRLALYLDRDPFNASTRRAQTAYFTVGISAVVVIGLLTLTLSSYLSRQIRLTRLKNDLIATVTHELKTPLASMRVLVDTLREGRCTSPQQTAEYFELISRENERLSRLIDNFLTFSRMERNKRVFDFAPVGIDPVVRAAVDAVAERFHAPGCSLDVDISPNLPEIYGDRESLTTVLVNLLDNAWKYSGDQKTVTVRTFGDPGHVGLEVADNGIGMSRRAMKRIFDRFYQVDQTLTRKAGGCGLGLSIVKFIVEAHGGTIDMTSQVGKGSKFTVRLPALSEEAAHVG